MHYGFYLKDNSFSVTQLGNDQMRLWIGSAHGLRRLGLAVGALGLLSGCAPEALYEPDAVFFAGRSAAQPQRSAAPRPTAAVARGGIIRAPDLPAAGDPAVVARFVVSADGPLTLGQTFTPGTLRPADRVALQIGEESLPTDLAVMATHPDGSVRHAVVSTTLPSGTARRATPALLVRLP
jgi:hypothetical protein